MHERRAGHLDGLGERIRLEDEHVRPLRQPRVGRLRPEELGRLALIGRARCEQVAQPEHRVEEPRPRLLHAGAVIRELADRAVGPADRRHRPRRVEGVAQRLGGCRRLRAGEAPVAVEVVRRLDRACERPLPLLAPAPAVVELALGGAAARAAAHHEEPDRRLAGRVARSRRPAGSARSSRAAPRSTARPPRRCRGRSRPRGSTWPRRASPRGSRGRARAAGARSSAPPSPPSSRRRARPTDRTSPTRPSSARRRDGRSARCSRTPPGPTTRRRCRGSQ